MGNQNQVSPGRRLRDLLAAPGILVCPGVYEGFSARLVEQAGFKKVTQAAQGLVTIRNFHDQPIGIRAFDQAPVSGDAELTVTTTADPQPTTRDIDDEPGVLGRSATFAFEEGCEIRFGWQITAPEGRPVTGLR